MASSIQIPSKLLYQVAHTRYQSTMGDSIFNVKLTIAAEPEILVSTDRNVLL